MKGAATRFGRARAAIERDPLYLGLFTALCVCVLVPLWLPRWLPLPGMGDHLAALAIALRHADESWGYARFYDVVPLPISYRGPFVVTQLLAHALPIELANKLFLSAYALSLPIAVTTLATQFHRSRWLALLSFPLVYSGSLARDDLPMCCGVVVLLFALWLLERFLAAPTARRAIGLLLLPVAFYATHPVPWMFFGASTIVLASFRVRHPRRTGLALVLTIVPLLFALRGAARTDASVDLMRSLEQLPFLVLTFWPGIAAGSLLVLLTLVWLALLTRAGDEVVLDARLPLIVLLAVTAYFVPISQRLVAIDRGALAAGSATILSVLALLLPRGEPSFRRGWIVLGALLVASYPIGLAQKWSAFDRRVAGSRRLAQRVPRGASTLTLVRGDGTDPAVDPDAAPYRQVHAYMQLLVGGFDPYAVLPYAKKPGTALPAPALHDAASFHLDLHGQYDYVLTKDEGPAYALFGPDRGPRPSLVDTDGAWRLYQIAKP